MLFAAAAALSVSAAEKGSADLRSAPPAGWRLEDVGPTRERESCEPRAEPPANPAAPAAPATGRPPMWPIAIPEALRFHERHESSPFPKTLGQLSLIFILSLVLFFPMYSGLGPIAQQTADNNLISETLRDEGVKQLTIVAFSVLFPVLADNVLDLIYVGYEPALVSRTYFLACIFLSFVCQYTATYLRYGAIFYCCAYVIQLWVLGCFSLIEMSRLSKFFSWPRIISVLTVFYIYCFLFVWFFTFEGIAVRFALSFFKFASFFMFLLLFLINIVLTALAWYRSQKNLAAWYRALNNDVQNGIIISVGMFTSFFTYMVLALTLNSIPGFASFSVSYLYGYLTLCIVCSLMITILPQRKAKAQAIKLQTDLETKRTFVRYISHELR